ncbi:TolB family protein [Hymenobacter fodinae]|uniref:Biopolymer transporter TolR n=1 Tax=Hymenobacter fodinae TaxID=2510796 RepID=A0A4Z0P7Z9_9BACT|nr:TolB family protein [Hymenobacter fodinae]TGE08502.1 biopolymer transporter TolR [Hymenobacter fodinae]
MRFSSSSILLTCLATLLAVGANGQQLGVFTAQQSIGNAAKPGTATFTPASQVYAITSAGPRTKADAPAMQYAYKKLGGDFLLYARISFAASGKADSHQSLGWLVRKSLEPGAPQVALATQGNGATTLRYRSTAGAAPQHIRSSVPQATVLQLERTGTTFTMRVAQFGQPFVVAQTTRLELGEEVYVGLFAESDQPGTTAIGTFRDVRVVVPAPDKLVQYRQYLGSHLEVLEVATGNREIIYSSLKSLQAPNWTRDGQHLIYNSEGLMYNFSLATRQVQEIPTGEVRNNNNDHVLSFDGKMLGLSSGVDQLGGSIVYTVPVAGGTPTQITPRGPSYLHSWTPDGQHLLFTGQRNNDFDIYRVPAAGGPEVRLTTAPGLDDGAEYTPDGQFIYFNSNRTGTMQIWRMKADGSQQQVVTTGDFQDWFPHISPDGKWIVFLSFLKDEVPAGDHPFYKHVYLRLMPIGGGTPKVIAYVYGGQGTINTPSWSPDGKRLAFISNSLDAASH